MLTGRGWSEDKQSREHELIKLALEQANGSVTRAARTLGMSYPALNYMLRTRHKDLPPVPDSSATLSTETVGTMPVKVDLDHLPPFPKRIPEKLRAIRKRLKLTPAQIAPKVGAKTGAEIEAYENNEDDLLVSVLWAYARLSGNPIMNLLDDDLEVNLG